MQYSNLKNEADQEEGRPKVARKFNINMSTEDLLKKKESYWFLALIITLIIIGSIIFYCAHTGGMMERTLSFINRMFLYIIINNKQILLVLHQSLKLKKN